MKKILITFLLLSIPIVAKSNDFNDLNMFHTKPSQKEIKKTSIIINKQSSILEWKGGLKFINNNHNGNLKIKSGRISFEENNKITGNIIIDMLSMTNIDLPESRKQYLINHLSNEDFFDVEKFPSAILKINNSKILEKKKDGKYNMEISGDLTIKSITKPVTFNAIVDLEGDIKSATGKIVFNRTDFNVQYRSEMHLNNSNSFWNKVNTSKKTVEDKVIMDEIEVQFYVVSIIKIFDN